MSNENYCIVDNGIIENIIVCDGDDTAAQFGALPSYDGAEIGDIYAPPPAPPKYTELQQLAQALTDEQLARMELEQLVKSTLANEIMGGGVTSKPLEPQGIAGVALLMKDGRVAVLGVSPHD